MASGPIAIIPIFVTLAGCATVTRGSTESLVIESEPSGARAEVSPPGLRCTTPCSVELKRKRNYVVELRKDGYDTTRVQVGSVTAAAGRAGMAGNVLVGGIIGMGVDTATGATRGLSPNPVRVLLLPTGTAPPAPPPPDTSLTAAVAANENCIQPSVVDRETCLGRLKLGMAKDEVVALLGAPDGTSRDGTTLRYGDRYLKFDADERLLRISDRPI